MQVDVNIIVTVFLGACVTLMGFLLKHWFEKLNKSQERIIQDMQVLKEHRVQTTTEIKGMKESWQDVQKKLWEDIKELSESMQSSFEKISIKVEKNSIDIQNIKSENRFISRSIKDLKDKENAKRIN